MIAILIVKQNFLKSNSHLFHLDQTGFQQLLGNQRITAANVEITKRILHGDGKGAAAYHAKLKSLLGGLNSTFKLVNTSTAVY